MHGLWPAAININTFIFTYYLFEYLLITQLLPVAGENLNTFDCCSWNCINLAPLPARINCQPRRYYFRPHDFIFVEQPAPWLPQTPSDYSFDISVGRLLHFCANNVLADTTRHDGLLETCCKWLVGWSSIFFTIERQKTSQLLWPASCLIFCWCRWLRKRAGTGHSGHFLDRSLRAACVALSAPAPA